MHTNPSKFLAASILLLAVLSAGTVQAQDYILEMREAAKTWAMHTIAELQAAVGDVQGAKRTVSQIDDDCAIYPGEVTGVWFCNGRPIYDHPPEFAVRRGIAWQAIDNLDRAADHVPTEVPHGLPAKYLAADPRHGAVVAFTDEYDSHGMRVTSRTYADGYAVIETPR